MKEFRCSVAQNGFFAGPVFWLRPADQPRREMTADPEKETERLHEAIRTIKENIERKRGTGQSADIRETVLSILNDPVFVQSMERGIRELSLSAPDAAMNAAAELTDRMESVSSDYIRSRQEDIRGVAVQLTAALEGDLDTPEVCSAICASSLSPARLASMDEALTGGLLTEKGSPNSHVSILAGNLNIPYLYGNPDAVAAAEKAAFVILDSETGTAVFDPDERIKESALLRMAEIRENRKAEEHPATAAASAVRCRTKVYANIEGPQDIGALLASGADGVGLFRTEFLFLNRQEAPTEDEQFQAYHAVLEAMGEKEVIIRTMDVGSDKQAPCLALPDETNPALGLRGVRVSLERKELFRIQLRALLRAGVTGNLKVMFPMITSAREIDEIRDCVSAAAEQLEKEGVPFRIPELGIMVETPAAALRAEDLAEKVGFFSIGTNDLTQYTLALDRESQGLDRYFDPGSEAVFKLIRMTAEGGHKHGIKTGVCGQLASDPKFVKRLIEAGIDELSVPVRKVQTTRQLASQAERSLAAEKKENIRGVAAVADGELIPMREIPDPVFSAGTMGECFGILPSNGKIYSPVTGTVIAVAETGHAVTVRSDDGLELLIHAGIDTVRLGKQAFIPYVKAGDPVRKDQLILEADLEMIRAAGLSPMIITAALN